MRIKRLKMKRVYYQMRDSEDTKDGDLKEENCKTMKKLKLEATLFEN